MSRRFRFSSVLFGLASLLIFSGIALAEHNGQMEPPLVDIIAVEDALRSGEELLQQGDFAGSIALVDRGLEILGDSYYFSGLADDTGQKLMLAEMLKQEGNLEGAAGIKQRMLVERLQLFTQKYGTEWGCQPD